MNWQTGLLILIFLVIVLYCVYHLKLHWLWVLGFFLLFLTLGAIILMNQHGYGGMQDHHWNAISILIVSYMGLIVFVSAIYSVRMYTETLPEILKRIDRLNTSPPIVIQSSPLSGGSAGTIGSVGSVGSGLSVTSGTDSMPSSSSPVTPSK